MNHEIHFSSAKDDWKTPIDLFQKLDAEFGFDLDAAASAENTLCDRFYTKETDGLTQPWTGTVWCNPPYGKGIENWIEKAIVSAAAGATVVMLLPARMGSRWFNACLEYALEIRYPDRRLYFGDASEPAPFPSCVIVFGPSAKLRWASGRGDVSFVMRQQRKPGLQWFTTRIQGDDP